MSGGIGRRAAIPNPALAPLAFLIGEWSTEGSHALLPGVALRGRASFEWAEGGAFLIWRSEMDDPRIPSGIACLGTDDETGECTMLYFDERGVSRRYSVEMLTDGWRWWRDAKDFAQRYVATLMDGGKRMVAAGELNRGKGWEPDLQLTYTRI
jgi:hypothetical protein